MKLEHVTGTSVETDKLPDVDAELMEACKKIHELFFKYNRQLFLIGEMVGKEGRPAVEGCSWFHIGPLGIQEDKEAFQKALGAYYGRIDGYIRSMSNHQFGIGRIPPPVVEPYNIPPTPES